MVKPSSNLLISFLLIPLLVAACGTAAPAQPAQPAQKVGGENNGEGGGGEAVLVTYSDAKQGFSIGHPDPGHRTLHSLTV